MARVFRHLESGFAMTTHSEAEKAAGFPLDRRLNYSITEAGNVEEHGVVTLRCTGCSCGCEGGCSCGDGPGCRECGYTGRRRYHFGFPARSPEERRRDREVDRVARQARNRMSREA